MSNLKKITVDGSFKHDLQIPNSWTFDELQEVIEVVGGSQPPKSDFYSESSEDRIRLIQIRDYKSDKNIVYIPREKAKRFVFKDEIMIGRYGPPIFQILRGLEGAYNVALMKAKPRDNIFSNEYLFYYLKNQNIYRYVESASDRTAGQSGVNKRHLEKYPVGVPPLNEQKRIVEKLDSLLAQVDTIQQRLNNLPDIIKRFRQSVLAAAVSGKLTEQWRENNEYKHQNVKLGDLIESGPQNGIYKPSKFYGSGTKIIRIDSIYDGELINWDKIKCLALEKEELDRYKINLSDILINRVNSIEYLGKCGLVKKLPGNAVFESNIMRLSVNLELASPEFITLFLTSPTGLVELRKNAKLAVNQASINQTDVKNCKLLLPLVNEQNEIVRLVEQYFALADTLEKNLANAKQRVDNLTQSILAKAFRGELVPQDPNDEPADKLLARIKAARLEAEKLEKAAKKVAKASKK